VVLLKKEPKMTVQGTALHMGEIAELKEDAEWAMSGNGPGFMSARDVLDLIKTIDKIQTVVEGIYREL